MDSCEVYSGGDVLLCYTPLWISALPRSQGRFPYPLRFDDALRYGCFGTESAQGKSYHGHP